MIMTEITERDKQTKNKSQNKWAYQRLELDKSTRQMNAKKEATKGTYTYTIEKFMHLFISRIS